MLLPFGQSKTSFDFFIKVWSYILKRIRVHPRHPRLKVCKQEKSTFIRV